MKRTSIKTTAITLAILLNLSCISNASAYIKVDPFKMVANTDTYTDYTRITDNDSSAESLHIVRDLVGNGMAESIILTDGVNYADTISANLLAKKNNAPMLLVVTDITSNQNALDLIGVVSK